MVDRGILVGTESLFFRSIAPAGNELAYIALLDLFQYETKAINEAEKNISHKEAQEIVSSIQNNNRVKPKHLKNFIKNSIRINRLTNTQIIVPKSF